MRRSIHPRAAFAAGSVALVAALATALTPTASAAGPASKPGADRSNGASDVRSTGPDYHSGKKVKVSAKESETINVKNLKGPAKLGDTKYWLGLDDYTGNIYLKSYTLRGIGNHIEVWVANDRAFPGNDCRNALGLTDVTDQQVSNFIHEFDNNILPAESTAFSVAPKRNGHHSLLPRLVPNLKTRNGTGTMPRSYYNGEGDNTVVLVDNVRDANYYDPTSADGQTYIAGFFYSVFNEYFDRNVMTIDVYDWAHRTGANPPDDSAKAAYIQCATELGSSRPLGGAKPRLYEGTFAHEYQHLLEYYADPDEVSWVNEGLSDWAQTLVGYVDPSIPANEPGADSHLACIQGYQPTNFGGPENSLTLWGDQGGPEILCDYGAAYSMMEYLASHYGEGFMHDLHSEPGNGLQGLQNVLDSVGAGVTAQQTLHDWAASLAVDGVLDDNGGNAVGVDPASVSIDSMHAMINWSNPQAYDTPGAPPNGSDYVRLRDGSGNPLSADALNSIEFTGDMTYPTTPVEWTLDSTPPDTLTGSESCGSAPAPGTGAPALYSGCGNNLDRSIVQAVTLPAGSPSLSFDALWDTEPGWDFGFVQLSTDGGAHWHSLATADTTSDHDPGAIGAVTDNLPGFDGDSGGWRSESVDLSAFAGQNVLIAFRYITDSGVAESGFWVRNITVGGTTLPSDSVATWQTMSEVHPAQVAGWNVRLVGYGPTGPAWVTTLPLDGSFAGSLSGADLKAALGDSATVVGAIVTLDDPSETQGSQARYHLTANGVEQPGG